MSFFSSKRRVVALAAFILLVLFLLRPGAARLKSRIIFAISQSVGRPADVGEVHMRLLPRPGFDLNNLVIYDDPAFGAEPILRASEVTADLRLMSLVRGRLEISRLDLTEPSLNLVHAADGRWNLEALLERTAHTPLAPTGKTKSEPRPAFPYIEGSSGRINFKVGAEKKSYALTNADFSLWQDSENAWGVRLKAQPFRSDFNLNDTGLLQADGTWQRAAALRDTPLEFRVEWSRAQLGQFTKFFTGTDQGWRGAIQIDATLAGTPAKLLVKTDSWVDDFRRYDITSGTAMRLSAHCDAGYSSLTHEFNQIACSAPVGGGLITAGGNLGLPGRPYAITITAKDVPASGAAALAMRIKKNLPDDLLAEGMIHGHFLLKKDGDSSPAFEGRGEISGFRLSSAADKAEISAASIPLLLTSGATNAPASAQKRSGGIAFPKEARLEFGPITIEGGTAGGSSVRGWVNRRGCGLSMIGGTDIAKVLRMARMAGVPALPSTPEGSAQVDLQIEATWTNQSGTGFSGPAVLGTAKLHNVLIASHGTGPVEILSADMQLLPDAVKISKLNAKAAAAEWTGSLEMSRGCVTVHPCSVRVALNTGQVSLSDMKEFANPSPKRRPWYRVLEGSSAAGPSPFANLRATGHVTAARFRVRGATASHVTADVELNAGKLQVSDLTADLFGGQHRGSWQVDFSTKPAICAGSGTLAGVSMTGLADVMKDNWIEGTAHATYELTGPCQADFLQSAEGTLQIDMKNGVFRHVVIPDDGEPLRATRLTGEAEFHAGKIEIKDVKVDSPQGKYQINGSASFTRQLDLRLGRISAGGSALSYNIHGPLSDPRISPATAVEQARLKPAAAK